MTQTAEVISTADLLAQFQEAGEVYVGHLQIEDALALIRDTGRSADEFRIEGGCLKADERSPALRKPCAASFESIANTGHRRCSTCTLPAFMHSSDLDRLVVT